MSSIRLLKNREDKKPGDIISVGFFVGKQLIADGIGEYPDAPAQAQPLHVAGHSGKTSKPAEPKASEPEPEMKPTFPPEPAPEHKHKQQK